MTRKSGSRVCRDCGESTSGVIRYNGEVICDECSVAYVECVHCDSVIPEDDAHLVENHHYCGYCYANHTTNCGDCGDRIPTYETVTIADGRVICESCESNGDYYCCEECMDIFPYADPCDCADRHSGEDCLRDYCTRVNDVFRGCTTSALDPKVLYCGIELEVQPVEEQYETAETVHSWVNDFCILKEDGSLCGGGEEGIEIVSRPLSHQDAKRSWKQEFFKPLQSKSQNRPYLLGHKEASYDCGMHIHLSRGPLTTLQIGRILAFIQRGHNAEFLAELVGRPSTGWSRGGLNKKISDVNKRGERYEALNLGPSHTIEFRLFASTLNELRFMANIDFCYALAEWTQPAARSLTETTNYVTFIDWVEDNRKSYPDLYITLVEMGYLNPRPNSKQKELNLCA